MLVLAFQDETHEYFEFEDQKLLARLARKVYQLFQQFYRVFTQRAVALAKDYQSLAAAKDALLFLVGVEYPGLHCVPHNPEVCLGAEAVLLNPLLVLFHHLQYVEK